MVLGRVLRGGVEVHAVAACKADDGEAPSGGELHSGVCGCGAGDHHRDTRPDNLLRHAEREAPAGVEHGLSHGRAHAERAAHGLIDGVVPPDVLTAALAARPGKQGAVDAAGGAEEGRALLRPP